MKYIKNFNESISKSDEILETAKDFFVDLLDRGIQISLKNVNPYDKYNKRNLDEICIALECNNIFEVQDVDRIESFIELVSNEIKFIEIYANFSNLSFDLIKANIGNYFILVLYFKS